MWNKYVRDSWATYTFGYLLDIYYWDHFLFLYELNEMTKLALWCISSHLLSFSVENNCHLYAIISDTDLDPKFISDTYRFTKHNFFQVQT